MVALYRSAAAAARLHHGIQVRRETSPVESSQSSGGAEFSIKQVKAKAGAIERDSRPGRRGSAFLGCFLTWLAKHAAESIMRHRRGADGRTPYERRSGRPFRVTGFLFRRVRPLSAAARREGVAAGAPDGGPALGSASPAAAASTACSMWGVPSPRRGALCMAGGAEPARP